MNNETSRLPIPTTFVGHDAPCSDNDKLMVLLVDAVRNTTSELTRQLERGKQEIESASADLRNGLRLNRCGILQSTGIEIDKLVAQRQDAIDTLVKAAYHLGYAEPTADLLK